MYSYIISMRGHRDSRSFDVSIKIGGGREAEGNTNTMSQKRWRIRGKDHVDSRV